MGPQNLVGYSKTLVDEVMPIVDKAYNVSKDRNSAPSPGCRWAAPRRFTGLNHLDKFASIASFSGAFMLFPGAAPPTPAPAAAPPPGGAVGARPRRWIRPPSIGHFRRSAQVE